MFGSSLLLDVCRRALSYLRYLCMFGSSLLPVVCRRALSYLCYLSLFTHGDIRHILYCVFLRLVCPMLPVSLDCTFFIPSSVFSNVYLLVSLDCTILISNSVFSNVFFLFCIHTIISSSLIVMGWKSLKR